MTATYVPNIRIPSGDDDSWRPEYQRLLAAWLAREEVYAKRLAYVPVKADEDVVDAVNEYSCLLSQADFMREVPDFEALWDADETYQDALDNWRTAEVMVNHQRRHGSPGFTWEEAFILLGLG